MILENRTKELRDQRKMTAESLCYLLEDYGIYIIPNTVYLWGMNKTQPRLNTLFALADIFGCEIGDIIHVADLEKECD